MKQALLYYFYAYKGQTMLLPTFKTSMEYYKWAYALPPHLQNVLAFGIDEMGEPLVEDPSKIVLTKLLQLHWNTSGNEFVSDAEQMFPTQSKELLGYLYVSSLVGAQLIVDKIKDEGLFKA